MSGLGDVSVVNDADGQPYSILPVTEDNPLLASLSSLQLIEENTNHTPINSDEDNSTEYTTLITGRPPTKERTLGTFAGVFCPVAMSMFSTLLFLRLGFVLGQAGLIESLVMFFLAYLIMVLTILSICAISTNGAIEGGGAYFMISRALGPEFGGGIGLVFFLAQGTSCALYTSGLVEAITVNFGNNGSLIASTTPGLPMSYWWSYLYASVCLFVCLFVSLVGGHLYGKTNVFTFIIVMVSASSVIVSMAVKHGMCVAYPAENNRSSWAQPNSSSHPYPNCSHNYALYTSFNADTFLSNIKAIYTEDYSTGRMMNFAVVFSVLFSGVTGLMNGANMSGELKNPGKSIPWGTLGACFFTLSTFILLLFLCSATTSRDLLIGNYNFMLSINVWPPFVAIGLLSATLSAALGNLIGGSRILFALAQDDIYGIFLRPAAITTKGGNPIVAVLFTWILVQLILLVGSLNQIAPMCSEMFLLSYAMTNLACLALDLTSAPNFRPMFKYFSSLTAFLGMVGCLGMCFFINYAYALIAIAILMFLVIILHFRGFENAWGSISQALIFHQVRKYLLLLDSRKNHIKFWRPQMLLMVNNPRMASQLIDFINDLKKSGLFIVGHVKLADFDECEVDPLQKEQIGWLQLIEKLRVKAFVELTVAATVRQGMAHLVRLSGIGGMKPNTVCLGFYDDSPPVDTFVRFKDKQPRKVMKLYNRNGKQDSSFDLFADVTGVKSFSKLEYVLMIREALKLNKNVCLFRHFQNLDKERLQASSDPMYIDAWPYNFFTANPTTVDFDKTCLFLLQLACVLHMVPKWRKHTTLRIFACSDRDQRTKIENHLSEFLHILRIRAQLKIVEVDEVLQHLKLSSDITSASKPVFSDSYPNQVNQLIFNQSHHTAALFLYLPAVPSDEQSQITYLRQLDLLTQDLPPTVLVHGLQPVICTTL